MPGGVVPSSRSSRSSGTRVDSPAVPLTEKVRAVGSENVRAMSISGSVAGGTGEAVSASS